VPISTSVPSIAAILIFAFVAFSVLRSLVRGVSLIRNTKVRVTGEDLGNQGIHVRTPFGSLDIQKSQTHDPALEGIPRYPGSMPTGDKPGYEMQLHFLGRDGQFIEEQYWTADPAEIVIGYYEREFPGWQKDRDVSVGARLQKKDSDLVRTIEIRSDDFALREVIKNFPSARSIIKYSVMRGRAFGKSAGI